MAASNPVILDSSSPPPFRHPSITPRKSNEAASSSPGLPEVSSFFKSNQNAPAAAPRIIPAAKAPTIAGPALPGFASAGTLWKAAALEAERNDDGRNDAPEIAEHVVPVKKSTGKLVRAVKKAQTNDRTASPVRARTRTPSVSLSEFDFKPQESSGSMQQPQAAKKAARRAVKPKDDHGSSKAKKTAGKAKDGKNAVLKATKRAAKSTSGVSPPRTIEQVAKLSEDCAVVIPPDETTPNAAAPAKSKKPSVSLTEYEYEFKQPMATEVVHQASNYFLPSASNSPRLPQVPAATEAKVAPKQHSPVYPSASKSGASPEEIDKPTSGVAALRKVPARKASISLSELDHRPEANAPIIEPGVVASPMEDTRKASISLSEFDYRPDGQVPAIDSAPLRPKAAKKPRKRATTDEGPAKKPKKKFAKSESIIVDSDEPDPAVGDDTGTTIDRRPSVEQIQAAASAPKAKKAAKRPKVTEAAGPSKAAASEVPEGPGFGVWSQSAYFIDPTVARTIEVDATAESLQTVFAVNGDPRAPVHRTDQLLARAASPASPLQQQAISRRRSWTPAENTYEVPDPEVDSSGESPAVKMSLADLVGGFGYDDQAQPRPRSPVGEPLTKRRRIEVADGSSAIPVPRKVAAVKEKVKRVKAPKKKPQTITDLATKAYRVEEAEAPNAQPTVSEFFAAQKDDHGTAAATVSTETNDAPPTFKKPRKPRAKKVEGEASTSTTKKTPKTKKVKVKFNEAAHLPTLLSPQQARAKEKKQGFLFGTSSQLALEEDVNYVRDLQMAILESEAGGEGDAAPKLSTRVSIGQAERRLFWIASRDSGGHVIAANGVRRKRVMAVPRRADVVQGRTPLPEIAAEPDHSRVVDIVNARQDSVQGLDPEHEVSQVVDLCGTSPVAAVEGEEETNVAIDLPLPSPQAFAAETESAAPALTAPDVDDRWMLLGSDSSDIEEQTEAVPVDLTGPAQRTVPTAGLPPARPPRTATSPIRVQTQPRTALTTLDSNIAMLARTSPAKQLRAFATQTSPGATKRPRGRPPKAATTTSAAALSPKRRGRPSKSVSQTQADPKHAVVSASQPPLSSDFVAIDDISDSGSEDIPLKDISLAKSVKASPKRRGRPPKASQQSPMASPSKSSFVNLEDISDSDAGKQTPSPRRRKVVATSPVQTLELSPSALVDTGLPPILDGKAAMKPTDTCWLPVSKVLFPQIAAVVKSTAPCGENGELSWWEKILMYDPIVLEDLTAWLVGRGVGVTIRRKAVKEKKKGRKKKGEIEEEVVQVEEFEVVKEELKGWMVQKWCEEKSICCLWREGLRGGVKVRY